MTLSISQSAFSKLLSLMSVGQRLRIQVAGGGCSGLQYRLSWEPSGDSSSSDKTMYLSPLEIAVDARSSFFLDGVILHHSEGLEGKGFEWVNPNAKRTCGCGSSFSV